MCRKLTYLFLVLFVPAVGTVAQAGLPEWEAAIKGASPLHWYKFNEATGTNCVDSGSGALNGAYDGVSLAQAGFFGAGAAVGFTRTGANRANFTGATDLPGPWTVEYVVKTTKPPAANDSQALHDSDTTSIRLAGWTALGETGFTRYGVADYQFTPAAGLTLNDLVVRQDVWMHMVFRNNGSGTQLFFNGKLMGTSTSTVELPRLRIGGRGAGPADHLMGVMDEAVVFNRALTDADILAHTAASSLLDPSILTASNPTPADGAIYADTWVNLSWSPGAFAVSHDVYLGNNFDDVNAGTGGTFRVNQAGTYYVAGFPGFAYPDGLVPGTTYYWRIDEVDPANTYKGKVWSFMVPPKTAYNPNPADGAQYVKLDASLSWTAGFGAKLHTVYFGDNLDTVTNAAGGTLQSTTTYNPGPLAKDKTYYWRVDEFDGAATYKGKVWSFSTIPTFAIKDTTLMGWWSLDEGQGTTALDWSGHDNHGDLVGGPQWVAGQIGLALAFQNSRVVIPPSDSLSANLFQGSFTLAIWINPKRTGNTWQQVFRAIKTDNASNDTLFLNNDGRLSWRGRVGGAWAGAMCETAPDVVPANQWTHAAVTGDGTNFRIYVNGALSQEAAFQKTDGTNANYYIGGNTGATTESYAGMIDDARVYNKALTADEIKQAMRGDPLVAWNPSPANGSTPDIDSALPLSWSAGDNVAQHDVYFSTDRNAVADAGESDATGVYRGRQAGTNYTPPEGVLWGGGPYYWRIDEINTDATVSKGRIWSFTVVDFILVDNFESYDAGDNQIWYAWHDGLGYGAPGTPPYFAGNGTGAAVGDETTRSFTEETIVHGGKQAMPLSYDNNKQGFAKYSEAERTLTAPRDWTKHSIAELSIWFRGRAGSVGSFVEGPVGTYTMTASGADIWNQADQFHYAFKTLSGVGSIEAQVLSVDNTDPWAKCGVMIRETLDAGSKFAAIYITPGNGCRFQARVGTGVAATSDTSVVTTQQTAIKAPYWVKIERDAAGNFKGYYSSNGTTWTPMSWNPQNIAMASNVYIGLALTSHNNNATCTAKFSGVKTTGTVGAQWANQDIGIASNAAEPLYVAVSNSAGSPAVVVHSNPAAAQLTTWTEWVIPLSALSAQGINLTNVDKITIGLGTRGNMTTADGSGKMYFDDIRLYQPRTP